MLDRQKILRVNCPGSGHESNFSAGCAKPLYEYNVIIVNPVSSLHLFDKDPELLKQVEEAQLEGSASYSAKSDKLIESVNPDLDQRVAEMVKFLEQGGLLIYFLSRPFAITGPTMSMDNYAWLDVLAPDHPSGAWQQRHMASVSHGKDIHLTSAGESSTFDRYLKQASLEWTTLIRAENLTSGYTIWATAGANKCVSACLSVGEQGGSVLFLPAPYQKQFDHTLINCIEHWQAQHWLDHKAVGRAVAAEEFKHQTAEKQIPDLEFIQSSPALNEAEEPKVEKASLASELASDIDKALTACFAKGDLAESEVQCLQPKTKASEPQELMEKLENISRSATPEWCHNYSFSHLEQMHGELNKLNDTLKQTQEKIDLLTGEIDSLERLKNALVAQDGDELQQACLKVFEKLGFKVKQPGNQPGQFWLAETDSTSAILQVLCTDSQPKSKDLAALAESIVTYWGEHEAEPKGILVASTHASKPPKERTEEDFSSQLIHFAEKKNLCLITTLQLLAIYWHMHSGKVSPKELREDILATNGRLSGYALDEKLAVGKK